MFLGAKTASCVNTEMKTSSLSSEVLRLVVAADAVKNQTATSKPST